MGTLYADPNSNINTLWNSNTFSFINDGVRSPTVPTGGFNETITADDTDDNEDQAYGMTNATLPAGFKVTNIKMWAYGELVDLKSNGVDEPYGETNWDPGNEKQFSLGAPPGGWSSVNWDVDVTTQAELDSLEVSINSKAIGAGSIINVDAIYIELTTEALPAGPANLAKWNGLDIVSGVVKWNGILWSDLAKYNGIS